MQYQLTETSPRKHITHLQMKNPNINNSISAICWESGVCPCTVNSAILSVRLFRALEKKKTSKNVALTLGPLVSCSILVHPGQPGAVSTIHSLWQAAAGQGCTERYRHLGPCVFMDGGLACLLIPNLTVSCLSQLYPELPLCLNTACLT